MARWPPPARDLLNALRARDMRARPLWALHRQYGARLYGEYGFHDKLQPQLSRDNPRCGLETGFGGRKGPVGWRAIGSASIKGLS